ncbi:Cell division protein FtsQ [Corynebacterium deserti GIMN1.010]|uniref:Cell division protein FtsQ n=1 Tax=Corynebacterium deserti GIMN1.010 TaxID=931089 RepID=A0A0M4CY75_9CORY|nr:FtsQ-type POTRA domain-containing protein [Corynebacterium deserti]ALC06337.1 Cell division protein FtsQ [Corynebacterium deserti GIMN1.010]
MNKKVIAIVVSVIVAAIAIAGAVAWFVPVLKVGTIDVTGAQRTDPEQVKEVSGIVDGENLLRIDARQAAVNIVELPWVKSVTVDRSLPSTVSVELVEREPAVYVHRSDGDYIYDTEGKEVLIGTPPVGTVEVSGADAENPNVMPAVISVINAIKDHDAALTESIQSIDAPDEFDILLKLNDGREIYWGSAENNHDKAVALSTVMKREGQHWNISSPSMVTVR